MELNSDKKIIIYGDIMLDKYFTGNVGRISPEAPVPVININKEHVTLGGAANVANNLAKLDNSPLLLGFIGKDNNGDGLISLCKDEDIEMFPLMSDNPTTTKIRVIGGHQQIARLDFEKILDVNQTLFNDFTNKLDELLSKNIGVFIISDYLKGACTNKICQIIIKKCKELNVPVIVDPKGNNWEKYKGATILTPNIKELEQVTNSIIKNDEGAIKNMARPLLSKYNIEHLLVTRSEKGMMLLSKDNVVNFSTEAKEVYDVSGAGDTVIATLSLGISVGMDIASAAKMANLAAGIVVSKFGTTPIHKDELLKAMNCITSKFVDYKQIKRIMEQEKQKGKKIVFTNGCFDILHKGHLFYLKEAAKLGDVLVLGLNSDSSVKKLKGETRPINNQHDRAEVLSFLEFISYIVVFDEETPVDLIKMILPDVLVKGGDYKANEVVGKEFAGKVEIIPFVEGYSTTNTLEKLKAKSY